VGEPLTLALDASTYSVEQLASQAHVWWQANGLKQAV
jgi:gluconokinase